MCAEATGRAASASGRAGEGLRQCGESPETSAPANGLCSAHPHARRAPGQGLST